MVPPAYADDFFRFRCERVACADSFPATFCEALRDGAVADFEVNNMSCLYLTARRLFSDWVELDGEPPASAGAVDASVGELAVESEGMLFRTVAASGDYVSAFLDPAGLDTLLTVEFSDGSARIRMGAANDVSYLAVVAPEGEPVSSGRPHELSVQFRAQPFPWNMEAVDPDMPGRVCLYTVYGGLRYELTAPRADANASPGSPDSNRNHLKAVLASGERRVVRVPRNPLAVRRAFNQSWVSYTAGGDIGVNLDASLFDIPQQHLLHLEYNGGGTGILPLKNALPRRSHSIRGDYSTGETYDNFRFPCVDFREYGSVSSGYCQETGFSDPCLHYTFHTDEIEAGEGRTEFTAPDGMEPLPVNRARFVENGAFASDSPVLADRFSRLQDENSAMLDANPLREQPCTDPSRSYEVTHIRIFKPGFLRIPVWSTDPFPWGEEYMQWLVDEYDRDHMERFGDIYAPEGSPVAEPFAELQRWLADEKLFSGNSFGFGLEGAPSYLEYLAAVQEWLGVPEHAREPEDKYLSPAATSIQYDLGRKEASIVALETDGEPSFAPTAATGAARALMEAVAALAAAAYGEAFTGKYEPDKGDLLLFDIERRYNPPATVENGTYLCTWLSTELDSESRPVWKDRFYYPDLMSRPKALAAHLRDRFSPSFDNAVDRNLPPDSEEFIGLKENSWYDIDSEVIIEAGSRYRYDRVSAAMVGEALRKFDGDRVKDGVDGNGRTVPVASPIVLDGKTSLKVSPGGGDPERPVSRLNINFDLLVADGGPQGARLLGGSPGEGLSIEAGCALQPYHHFFSPLCITLVNNRLEERRRLDLSEKFPGERVVYHRLSAPFGNILAVTEREEVHGEWTVAVQSIYTLSFDLKVLTRYSFANPAVTAGEVVRAGGDYRVRETASHRYPIVPVPESEGGAALLDEMMEELTTYRRDEAAKRITLGFSALFGPGSLYRDNNLYVPFASRTGVDCVLKLVATPGDAAEEELLQRASESLVSTPPAFLRVDPSAFVCVRRFEGGSRFQRRVRSVVADASGRIFATQYDAVCLTYDGDTILGINNDALADEEAEQRGCHFVYSQSLAEMASRGGDAPLGHFMASDKRITHLRTDASGCVSLVRERLKVDPDTGIAGVAERPWEIYDKRRRLVFRRDLAFLDKVYCVDAQRIADPATGVPVERFLLLGRQYGAVNAWYAHEPATGRSDYSSYFAFGDMEPIANLTGLSDSDAAIASAGAMDGLRFNLACRTERWPYARTLTIPWDTASLRRGWYNVNVFADLDDAVFEVRVDDRVLGRVQYDPAEDATVYEDASGRSADPRHAFFARGANSLSTSLSHPFIVGAAAAGHGASLEEVLVNGEDGVDPYGIRNATIERLSVFTRRLPLHGLQAVRLEGRGPGGVVLTLPCGPRPGTDTPVRYFRYNTGQSMSNAVSVTVSGTGMTQDSGEVAEAVSGALSRQADITADIVKINIVD